MTAVSIDPGVEACQALVAWINTPGTPYALSVAAEYVEKLIDPLEEIDTLLVHLVVEDSGTLMESLALEDPTSHMVRIWIRSKVADQENSTIEPLKLLVRQLFQRVNNFRSTNGRVQVWECDKDMKEVPAKDLLERSGLFVASILMRVEVEAS